MYGQIKVVTSPEEEIYNIFPGQYIVIGREKTSDVVLPDKSLSRHHCKIVCRNRQCWIEDLQSRNHTFVNEVKIDNQVLNDGDLIRIAKQLLQFSIINEEVQNQKEDPFKVIMRYDKLSGKIAIKLGLLNQVQVKYCIQLQAQLLEDGPYFPLVEVAEQEGLLDSEGLEKIKDFRTNCPFQVPDYWMQELIGMGGMGRIYKARSLKEDRVVACKIFCDASQKYEQYLREQFYKEANALLQFRHPNIVQGIELIDTKETLCIVMEFVEGPTLREYLKDQGGRLLIDEAIDIILQVAQALNHANSKGMIHRDIKPENILIQPDKVVKLCDFGLVREETEEEQDLNVFGTTAYMSPEQITNSKDIDIRSDIYSLGAVFYQLIFGQLPFVGTGKEIRLQHLQSPLTFPTTSSDHKDVVKIIKKMMAKSPSARYQTPQELISVLENMRSNLCDEEQEFLYTMEAPIPINNRNQRKKSERKIVVSSCIAFIFMILGFVIYWNASKETRHFKAISSIENCIAFVESYPNSQYREQAKDFFIKECNKISSLPAEEQIKEYNRIIELLQKCSSKNKNMLNLSNLQRQESKIQEKLIITAYNKNIKKIEENIEKSRISFAHNELSDLQLKLNNESESIQKHFAKSIENLKSIISISSLQYSNLSLENTIPVENNALPPNVKMEYLYMNNMNQGQNFMFCYVPLPGALECINPETGKLIWYAERNNEIDIKWILADPNKEVENSYKATYCLIYSIQNKRLSMYNPVIGKKLWDVLLPENVIATPLIYNDSIVIPCELIVYHVSCETGKIIGEYKNLKPIRQKPVIKNKLLYLASDNEVYIFNLEEKIQMYNKINNKIFSSVIPLKDGWGVIVKDSIFQLQLYQNKKILEIENPPVRTIELRGKDCIQNIVSNDMAIFQTENTIINIKNTSSINSIDMKSISINFSPYLLGQYAIDNMLDTRIISSWQMCKNYFYLIVKQKNQTYIKSYQLESKTLKNIKTMLVNEKFLKKPVITKESQQILVSESNLFYHVYLLKDSIRFDTFGMSTTDSETPSLFYLKQIDSIFCLYPKEDSYTIQLSNGRQYPYNRKLEKLFNKSWSHGAISEDEKMIFLTSHDILYAYKLQSGSKRCEDYYNNSNFTSPILLSKQTILVGDSQGYLRCINYELSEGKIKFRERWNFFVQKSALTWKPCIYKDLVYICSNDGILYCLSLKNGKSKIESFQTGCKNVSSFGMENRQIFIGDEHGKLVSISCINTPKINWSISLRNTIVSSPLLLDNSVFCVTDNGTIFNLNADTGEVVWSITTIGKIKDAFWKNSNIIYATTDLGFLYQIK